MGRGGRPVGERLVDGLNEHERLALLETVVFGTKHATGLDRGHDRLVARVEELESAERRRQMGWFARLMLRFGGQHVSDRHGAAPAAPRGVTPGGAGRQ